MYRVKFRVPATTWKEGERRVARALNGERVSWKRIGQRGLDVIAPSLAAEVKTRLREPSSFTRTLEKTRKLGGKRRIPIIVYRGPWARDPLVALRLSDFLELCRARLEAKGGRG